MGIVLDDFTKTEISELAREFARRRKFLGLSQLKLARFAGLSSSIISKFENCKIDPSFSTILKIERALSERESFSNLRAEDVMISEVFSVGGDCLISDALKVMRERDFTQILVVDVGQICGVVYEKNILDAIAERVDIYSEKVSDILDVSPVCVPRKYSVTDLSFIFQNKRTKFVLVCENSEIFGIVTHSDLFKH